MLLIHYDYWKGSVRLKCYNHPGKQNMLYQPETVKYTQSTDNY